MQIYSNKIKKYNVTYSNSIAIIFFIVFLFSFKIQVSFAFTIFDFYQFGEGNDANYYDNYATGLSSEAVNVWPKILRYFNDLGVYSRDIFRLLNNILGFALIPLLLVKISLYSYQESNFYFKSCVFLFYSISPTIVFYSLDIYRDIPMLFIWVLSVFIFLKYLNSSSFKSFILLLFLIGLSFVLFLFRPYLGFSFFISLVSYKVLKFEIFKPLSILVLLLISLQLLSSLGLLDALILYRSSFSELSNASSNLGISFENKNIFLLDFLKSFCIQVFGIYVSNPISVLFFLLESLIFIISFTYVVRNYKYANDFVRFCFIFFVIYTSVWVLGNDNFGTGLRLRIFSYFSIYICMYSILITKRQNCNQYLYRY
jgi:hypothetical protein